MNLQPINILNIGLDRGLLACGEPEEVQVRQSFYAKNLPARLVHIVKAPFGSPSEKIDIDAQLSIVPCPVRHWSQFVPAAIRLGAELLRRESFDLIQVQEPFVCGLVGAYLAKRFRIPLVVGLFSDEIDNPLWLRERKLNRIANVVGKYVLRRAAATRTDSRAVAARVAGIGCRNLTYIPFLITNADRLLIPSDRIAEIRDDLLAGLSGPLLLAVNRLEAEKNVSLMLRALAVASRQLPGIVLAIAGTGRLESLLREEAERLLPGRVRWLGWVPGEQMADYYQVSDLMLISSDRESAARVLFESLLAGTPVISTATAGANEVIEDAVTGRIVAVGDETAFANAVVELARNPVRLVEMGERGRERMRQMVTADAVVGQLRDFYRAAMVAA